MLNPIRERHNGNKDKYQKKYCDVNTGLYVTIIMACVNITNGNKDLFEYLYDNNKSNINCGKNMKIFSIILGG